jgi:hypothetical protein
MAYTLKRKRFNGIMRTLAEQCNAATSRVQLVRVGLYGETEVMELRAKNLVISQGRLCAKVARFFDAAETTGQSVDVYTVAGHARYRVNSGSVSGRTVFMGT